MKLFRFGRPGDEKPGLILEDGRKLDTFGYGIEAPQFIRAGQVIEWSIEELGSARQTAVQA